MTCSDFLARFSDYYDGNAPPADRKAFQEHLNACDSCHRYHRVVQKGVELLRALPTPAPRDDFHDRLRHSIYTAEEAKRRRRSPMGGSGAMTLVAMAAIMAAVIWTPALWEGGSAIQLPPIVVNEPAPSQPGNLLSAPSVRSLRPSPSNVASSPRFRDLELWNQTNALLYEHSSLYERYREAGLVRTGLQ